MLALISCQNWLYFSQSFPCMIVGFDVRVECENLVKICEEPWSSRLARDWLASGLPTKGHVRSTCWKLKSQVSKSISWLILQLGQLARCTANLFSVLYFGFLFDNTSQCYLVFASLFPYSLCFTFIIYCLCLRARV